MRSSKSRVYSLVSILVIMLLVLACSSKLWQQVNVPTLTPYSKTSTSYGQKLHFIISNPSNEKKQFSVICRDKETGRDRVAVNTVEVDPHSDKIATLLYPQLMFSRSIVCILTEEE